MRERKDNGLCDGRMIYQHGLYLIGRDLLPTPVDNLFDPTGGDAGNWKPHMHVFMPYLSLEEMGLTEMTSGLMLEAEGEPTANAIIILPGFSDAE